MHGSRFAALAALAVSLACGGDSSGPSRDKFAGIWDATKLEYTNTANTSEKVDIIALGATYVIELTSGGDYTATVTPPGGAPEIETGTWSASADVFTLKETGSSGNMQFDYTLSGNTLTASGANTDFDFDGDDVPEPARLSAVLVRQ